MGLPTTENLIKTLKTDAFLVAVVCGFVMGVFDAYGLLSSQSLNFSIHLSLSIAMLMAIALIVEDKFFFWAMAVSFPNMSLVFIVGLFKGVIAQFLWVFLLQAVIIAAMSLYHMRLARDFIPESVFGKIKAELKDARENSFHRLLYFSLIGCMKDKNRIVSQTYHVLEELFKVDKAVVFIADYKNNMLVPFAGAGLLNDKNISPVMVTPDFWEKNSYDPEKGVLNVIGGRSNLPSLRQLIPGANLDATAVMPLSANGRVIGLLAVIKQKPENRQYLEPQLFVTLAYVLASALDNCSIHEMRISMLDSAQKKSRQIEASFSKYVSAAVVSELVDNENLATLGGKKRNVTIMMADLRGFTRLTGVLNIEYLVQLLNTWFEEASTLILKNHGTIDKYMGDCIMVIFGAPLEKADDALRCVYTAFRLQEKFYLFQKNLQLPQGYNLGLGISITSGEAVVGNFGSTTRMEYTAIGETVNLASRLEKIAGAGEIVVDEATFACMPKNRFKYSVEKNISIKGIADQTVYRLAEIIQDQPSDPEI